MKVSTKLFPWLFALLLIIISLPSFVAIRNLWPMYTDARLRTQVQTALTAFADSKGLLLSDLALQKVTHTSMQVDVREYRRGKDPRSCVDISLGLHTVTPCVTAY